MALPADPHPPFSQTPLFSKSLRLRGKYAVVVQRILNYDPCDAYGRIAQTANPFKRIQTRREISLEQLFPKKKDGICDCGCGRALTGRQRRWATDDCSLFTWYVYAIIAGRRTEIRRCLRAYYGRKCGGCLKMPLRYKMANGRMRSGIEFDHIVPVHKGGGACWLSNYRPLCTDCHKVKTGADRVKRTV
jgi:5-methylcytosine-specific restriction endonuclease McrA